MKNLLLYIAVSLFAISANSQTFHAIIFANTNDGKIGASVKKNYYKMEIEFANIAAANGMELKSYYYKGYDYSKDQLMFILNDDLNCSSNDIVFFYHTGHGGRAANDKTKWPQLALGDTNDDFVSLNRVLSIVRNKNPQLAVVMSQSCNSIVQGLSAKEGISTTNSQIEAGKSSNYKKLFRNLRGTIIVSSSSPGEYSWSNSETGSFFTNAFLTELGKIVGGNGEVNWDRLFENTAVTKRRNLGKTDSEPQWEVNVRPAGSYGNTSPTKNKVVKNSDNFIADLLAIADRKNDEWSRIEKVNPTLNKYFVSDMAKVEIIGRNGRTLVDRQPAKKFLQRLSTTRNLVNIAVIDKQTNGSGKINEMKIHEIYYK